MLNVQTISHFLSNQSMLTLQSNCYGISFILILNYKIYIYIYIFILEDLDEGFTLDPLRPNCNFQLIILHIKSSTICNFQLILLPKFIVQLAIDYDCKA
jgi:hypothetical protein